MSLFASVRSRLRQALPAPGAGVLGPDSIDVGARALALPDGVCASFAVTGYPADVGKPLLTYPGRLDVEVHVEPTPPTVAADRLRRQLARLESSARSDAEHGRLEELQASAAADDARDLAAALARGQTRLFRMGLRRLRTRWPAVVGSVVGPMVSAGGAGSCAPHVPSRCVAAVALPGCGRGVCTGTWLRPGEYGRHRDHPAARA